MQTHAPLLALDVGGSKLAAGAVTPTGQVLYRTSAQLSRDMGRDALHAALRRAVRDVLDHAPAPRAGGINIPGLADFSRGLWVYACFSGIRDYPVARLLSDEYDLPFYVENDVNACACAERAFGCCAEVDDFLWVTVSNGIGGGLMLGGQLYAGAQGNAGEIGHLCMEPEGPLCSCGNPGCLEALAAGPGIARRYARRTGEATDAREIAGRARAGEAAAIAVMDETGTYIGRALAQAANLLNLPRYVLGGGVMQSFELLEPSILRAFERHVFRAANAHARIVQTALGYDAALLGAAATALRGMQNGAR